VTRSIDLLDAESADVEVEMLSKNAALITGRMSGRYRSGGTEKTFTQRYTSIWVTEDSNWRVRHEHSSTINKRS
jgi:ketosteroid isomerase-like protein